jgi:hypothetical protein
MKKRRGRQKRLRDGINFVSLPTSSSGRTGDEEDAAAGRARDKSRQEMTSGGVGLYRAADFSSDEDESKHTPSGGACFYTASAVVLGVFWPARPSEEHDLPCAGRLAAGIRPSTS